MLHDVLQRVVPASVEFVIVTLGVRSVHAGVEETRREERHDRRGCKEMSKWK